MSTEPLTRGELSDLRHAVDHRTGRPAIDSPRYRHELFRAETLRAEADMQAAAAKPAPVPNETAWATLEKVSAWRNPLDENRRLWDDPSPAGQQFREAVEHFRQEAIAGRPVPPEVLQDFRERTEAAALEAAELKRQRDAQALADFKRREMGY